MKKSYTTWDDPAVDKYVEGHLSLITRSLVDMMGDHIEAVILTGGFGRGEGSVARRADSFHTVNDYDIEIAYREPLGAFLSKVRVHVLYRRKLDALAEELAQRLHMKQVDFTLKGVSCYAEVCEPRLADFDLRYGHRLLYGRGNPVERMPAFESADIPAFEGTWLLRNRGIGLLLAGLYLRNGELRLENRENFYIEVSKALLAMGDALFILRGRYACRYSERAERIGEFESEAFEGAEALIRLYGMAASYKLRPGEDMYPEFAPGNLWFHVMKIYIAFFLFYETQRLEIDFRTLEDYLAWVVRQPKIGFKQHCGLAWHRLFPSCDQQVPTAIMYLKADKQRSAAYTMLLLAARRSGNVDTSLLRAACELSGTGGALNERTWRRMVSDFLLLIHPAGEVGRFLRSEREAR